MAFQMKKQFLCFLNKWIHVGMATVVAVLFCIVSGCNPHNSTRASAENEARWIARYYADVKSGETQAKDLVHTINLDRGLTIDAEKWKIFETSICDNKGPIIAYHTEAIGEEYIVIRDDLSINWTKQTPHNQD